MTCFGPNFSSDIDGCAACKEIVNDESKDNGKISHAPGPYLTSSTIWSELSENGQNEIIIESMDYGVEDWCSCPEGSGRKNENKLN